MRVDRVDRGKIRGTGRRRRRTRPWAGRHRSQPRWRAHPLRRPGHRGGGDIAGGDHRHVAQPGEQALRAAQPRRGQAHHRADDGRVELLARPLHQLAMCGDPRDGSPVGAGRGHHLVGVGDRDDASAEADLAAGQPARVARAVVPLVVLDDHVAPLAQPRQQRSGDLRAVRRVRAQQGPLLVGGLARLVEDRRRHAQLADVVQDRGPAQQVAVTCGDVHRLGDEVGEHPHPFGVTAGRPVVRAQGGDQPEDLPRGDRWVGARFPDPGELLLDRAVANGVARDREARGCAVGEEHAQLEQRDQRQGAPGDPVDHDERRRRHGNEDREVPGLFDPAPRGP